MLTQKRLVWAGLVLGLLLGLLAAFVLRPLPSEASRNGSGTYSLPSGNPVVTGTTITSAWANNTCMDIATELTNSLDRNGRGAMLAPLQLANGTKAAPALTFSAQPALGLYRAGATDLRVSCNNTDCTKWTSSGTDFPLSITAETLTANGDAIGATGNGSGRGLAATGGASSGTGVVATGGSTDGNGVIGVGVGGGAGVVGNAGLTGNGVVGNGGGNSGKGGSFTGGGTSGLGATATGGTPNGDGFQGAGTGNGKGVWGIGGTTGIGVVGAAGTNATAATRQDAIQATNGDIKLDGVANPNSNVAIKNRLTPNNMIKFWGKVTGGASPSINWGHNLSGTATCTTKVVTITLAQAMADTNFVIIADQQTGTGSSVNQVLPGSTTTFTWTQYTAGTQNDLCAGSPTVTFMGIGNQ